MCEVHFQDTSGIPISQGELCFQQDGDKAHTGQNSKCIELNVPRPFSLFGVMWDDQCNHEN